MAFRRKKSAGNFKTTCERCGAPIADGMTLCYECREKEREAAEKSEKEEKKDENMSPADKFLAELEADVIKFDEEEAPKPEKTEDESKPKYPVEDIFTDSTSEKKEESPFAEELAENIFTDIIDKDNILQKSEEKAEETAEITENEVEETAKVIENEADEAAEVIENEADEAAEVVEDESAESLEAAEEADEAPIIEEFEALAEELEPEKEPESEEKEPETADIDSEIEKIGEKTAEISDFIPPIEEESENEEKIEQSEDLGANSAISDIDESLAEIDSIDMQPLIDNLELNFKDEPVEEEPTSEKEMTDTNNLKLRLTRSELLRYGEDTPRYVNPKEIPPLLQAEHTRKVVKRADIDVSDVLPGKELIVKEKDGKYIAITVPATYEVKVLDCSEKEADMYRLDYYIRTFDLSRYAKVRAYKLLSEEPAILNKFFGKSKVSEIYEDELMEYLPTLTDMNDNLINSDIPTETLLILSRLSEKEQEMLSRIMAQTKVSTISDITAYELAEGKRDEITMREVVALDKRVVDMMARHMNKGK